MINYNHTIKSVKSGLEKGVFSAEEIFKHYLKRIEKDNTRLNAYLSVFKSEKNMRTRIRTNAANTLQGIPCAVKDNILIEGEKCTAASKILKNYTASYDAGVISKLKQAGVMFLGKTNMDEFAMGASGENSAFGPSKNPHAHERVAGGSSSGSAAAVAADLTVFALGSDTGGSIRCPASFCGIVGFKPTYGRVSRHGLIAMASSLDQIGPLAKTVEDAALVTNIISGRDPMDATSSKMETPDYTANLNKSVKGLRAALPKEFMDEGLDDNIKKLTLKTVAVLESLGAHVDYVNLPNIKYSIAAYYIIVPSEISANLARFDGIRYGLSENAKNLFEVYSKSREKGFGPEVKRRIMLGTYALSAGYYDAYYKKAQQVRAAIRKDFDEVFKKFSLIVGPTMPTPAFKLGEKADAPLSMYLADIFTSPANLAGLPAMSIPCGWTVPQNGNKKMPAGFQIIGKHFDEETVLQTGHQLEQANIKEQTI